MNFKRIMAILSSVTLVACHNTRVISISDLQNNPGEYLKEHATYKVEQKNPDKTHNFNNIDVKGTTLVGNGMVKIPVNNVEVIEQSTFSGTKTTIAVIGGLVGAAAIAIGIVILGMLGSTAAN